MNELPTIESGKIWENRSTKEILFAIMKGKKADYAVARVVSDDGAIDGEFLISKSSYVLGAHLLEDELVGYDALATLLTIDQGSYSLLDYSRNVEGAAHLEDGLKIRLTQLVNTLPNLPATLEELANAGGGGSAMSRMRSYEGNELPTNAETAAAKSARQSLNDDATGGKVSTDARQSSGPNPVMVAIIVMVLIVGAAALYFFLPH
jgi:hypothetical protein